LRRWAAIEAENSMHIPSNRRAVDTILVAAPPPVVLAYGIGVDSTALLIELEARGEAPDLVLSADPGAEKPETYEYQRMIAAWMHARGIPARSSATCPGASSTGRPIIRSSPMS
jgi:3'-phosphoadenosine 5'-phosphosulfate sulfotransferase (PAPS reductase)/FAD synthetase